MNAPPLLAGVPLSEVVDLLDLTATGPDTFAGGHTAMSAALDHVFGGLVAAQALVAAGRTVEAGRSVHSLHAYFLRRGDHRIPLEFGVTRTRDGRSISHRRVEVSQAGRVIAELSCSFAVPLAGPAHAEDAPATPGPETLRPDHEVFDEIGAPHPAARVIDGFDLRTVGLLEEEGREELRLWFRAAGPAGEIGDDPLLHAALLTYATDLRILHPLMRRHGGSPLHAGGARWAPATLDHTIWFHAPLRADAWLLHLGDSPWADHGRGLARGAIFTADGVRVADVAQEALLRQR